MATHDEEFERVIEARGIGLALVRNRPEPANVFAKQGGGNGRLARSHPVHVTAQRVDLAVMSDHAEWMREPPGRECVGGEALMDQRHRAFEARIRKILEVRLHLIREKHALVDERA